MKVDKESARKRELHRRRRSEVRTLIDEAKNRPCSDCGGCLSPWAMDFDHKIPGEKEFSIGDTRNALRFSRVRLLAEIAKCDGVRQLPQNEGAWH